MEQTYFNHDNVLLSLYELVIFESFLALMLCMIMLNKTSPGCKKKMTLTRYTFQKDEYNFPRFLKSKDTLNVFLL